jgi:hypothetical protein
MKKILFYSILILFVCACNKDKFQTKPQLTVKTSSDIIVAKNSGLEVLLEYTDKEGDVDDTLYIKKERLNLRTTTTIRDLLKIKVPEFPNRDKGEFQVLLDYQNYLISALNPPLNEPDTLNLKFVLKDKAGNVSDTVTLSNVIVIR